MFLYPLLKEHGDWFARELLLVTHTPKTQRIFYYHFKMKMHGDKFTWKARMQQRKGKTVIFIGIAKSYFLLACVKLNRYLQFGGFKVLFIILIYVNMINCQGNSYCFSHTKFVTLVTAHTSIKIRIQLPGELLKPLTADLLKMWHWVTQKVRTVSH